MLTTTLGKTGLTVSRMGLGCGGHSRLGLVRGATDEEAARIVREAHDLGVTFFDTAEAYGTETAVGIGLRGLPRESFVVSTKFGLFGHPDTAQELRKHVEESLRRIGLDYVDVFHLHAVMPDQYEHARNVLLPEFLRLKEEGKIRHVGITERFIADPGHEMLAKAVREDPWEVVMVGFSLLNPSARDRVLPITRQKGIGTLDMFAVRRALGNLSSLRETVEEMAGKGLVPHDVDLSFLEGDLQETAYRFCLWEPGIDVVLSGTGNAEHLRQNVRTLQGPPLPAEVQGRLRSLFGHVDSISGE